MTRAEGESAARKNARPAKNNRQDNIVYQRDSFLPKSYKKHHIPKNVRLKTQYPVSLEAKRSRSKDNIYPP